MAEEQVKTFDENKQSIRGIDREKICPMLIRVFYNEKGRHNDIFDYERGLTPHDELQIHTWLDASLKEISELVQEAIESSRTYGTYLDFSAVQPDPRRERNRSPNYRFRDLGTTCCGRDGPDDRKSLYELRFQPGDYIDVAVTKSNKNKNPHISQKGNRDRGNDRNDRGNDRRERRDRQY